VKKYYLLVDKLHDSEEEVISEMRLRLRSLREAQGLSIQDLAKMAGVSSAAISYAERGRRKPNYIWLCKVAKALDVTLDELIDCNCGK
jgi:transcriptional regulator with XRE-family HTH domain